MFSLFIVEAVIRRFMYEWLNTVFVLQPIVAHFFPTLFLAHFAALGTQNQTDIEKNMRR